MAPMHWIDWLIVIVPVVAVMAIAAKTKRYVRGVADFLAAGRAAGRYLVCNAADHAGLGAITVIALFELYYKSGFGVTWWQSLNAPVGLFITLTGFVIYRYRETRVMTIAQFFEVRYSKKFRVFMGILAWISGVINYGIFPAVSARFFQYYCGFPDSFRLGAFHIPTFAVIMAVTLTVALLFTLLGGQLTVMVADCIEGLLSGILYIIVALALLAIFSWTEISTAMADVPRGQSLLNPFDTNDVQDFNIWYVIIGIVGMIYAYMAWQGGHAFNASAANPHEAKMGKILGSWRSYSKTVMITLLAICAYTYMHHPDFSRGAAEVRQTLDGISDSQIRTQMTVPLALSHFLPIGIKGIFAAIMFFAMVACDSSYLHSWGSIFIQDAVLPFRKRQLSPQQHIRLLRYSIAGVAVFAFFFSFFFRQTSYILLFFALTGTIYLGGAGACIIGGLYWKRGTTQAAWTAAILGSILGVGGIVVEQLWPGYLAPALRNLFPDSAYLAAHADRFPVNGQWLWLTAMVSATIGYIIVSLITCRQPFNLERMLHRGIYAAAEDAPTAVGNVRQSLLARLIGIDSRFTRGDRFLSILLFSWTMGWFLFFVAATLWNLYAPAPWTLEQWSGYWFYVGICLPLAIGIITCIWFTIGGIRDLRRLFARLRETQISALDDGTVVGHHNLADEPAARNMKHSVPKEADADHVAI